ncbi:sulfotransferase [Thioalkalivibrio sp. AKL10]|uniref:sulfotransferase n=1 Tax=Thioalkalivibrio sp. AKL10 TaxID=1158158 RepID=UPI0012DC9C72|nr:sulfotransferase [Thioalkalivibrio sp. AKL10]
MQGLPDELKFIAHRLRVGPRVLFNRWRARNRRKIFVIGRNKTGTTSLRRTFEELGFPVGDQREAERLYDRAYFEGRFEAIVDYCHSAQVFQDVPFSCPGTFRHLDAAFPGSLFILTIRDSPEQWYDSLVRFHSRMFGRDGQIPTADDLRRARYCRKGFLYNTVRMNGTPDDDPYNAEIMIRNYRRHNREVMDYFRTRPRDLLVLNLAEPGAYQRFLAFFGLPNEPEGSFPWENRSS